jgi:hypothetical protein
VRAPCEVVSRPLSATAPYHTEAPSARTMIVTTLAANTTQTRIKFALRKKQAKERNHNTGTGAEESEL